MAVPGSDSRFWAAMARKCSGMLQKQSLQQDQLREITDISTDVLEGTRVWHARGGEGVVEPINQDSAKPYAVR